MSVPGYEDVIAPVLDYGPSQLLDLSECLQLLAERYSPSQAWIGSDLLRIARRCEKLAAEKTEDEYAAWQKAMRQGG